MEPLSPRDHAPLEYWFWKLHVGDLAFLVDVILRRRTGIAETRVSLWLRGEGRVEHGPSPDWSADGELVVVGATELRPHESHGSLGDVAWDLRWEEGPTLVTPLPKVIAWMEPLDLSIVVHPEARFSGTIEVGGERFVVTDLPGAFTHYWGRRLMDRWIWLSATQFEGAPERRLEAIVSSSRLFGGPPTAARRGVPVDDGRDAPGHGRVAAQRGRPDAPDPRRVHARRRQDRGTPPSSRGDLGRDPDKRPWRRDPTDPARGPHDRRHRGNAGHGRSRDARLACVVEAGRMVEVVRSSGDRSCLARAGEGQPRAASTIGAPMEPPAARQRRSTAART